MTDTELRDEFRLLHKKIDDWSGALMNCKLHGQEERSRIEKDMTEQCGGIRLEIEQVRGEQKNRERQRDVRSGVISGATGTIAGALAGLLKAIAGGG